MSFSKGNAILASELVSIKARVKAEMLRRNQVGSLASYGGSAYDYTVTPTAGGKILPEHWNKLITPMNAMVDTGLTTVNSGEQIPALDNLVTLLTKAESYSVTGNTTNCKASCSGLCRGTCRSTCGTGCSNTCSSSCSNDCNDTCTNVCSMSCGGSCSHGCGNDCEKNCAFTCNNNCSGGCKAACRMYCAKGVQGTE